MWYINSTPAKQQAALGISVDWFFKESGLKYMCMYAYIYIYIYIYILGCVRSKLWPMGALLHHVGSSVAVHGLSNCSMWVLVSAGSVAAVCGLSYYAACKILAPLPGIEPLSPALQGGFLTTGTPEKSLESFCFSWFILEGKKSLIKMRNGTRTRKLAAVPTKEKSSIS